MSSTLTEHQSPTKTLIWKIVALILTALVLFLYNTSGKPSKSPLERDFEAWLAPTVQRFLNSEGEVALPPITIKLSSFHSDPTHTIAWELKSSSGSDEHVLRILELMREADIFSYPKRSEEGSKNIVIRIDAGEKSFETTLTEQQLDSNVQARSMLKLFQVYADLPMPSSALTALNSDGTKQEIRR